MLKKKKMQEECYGMESKAIKTEVLREAKEKKNREIKKKTLWVGKKKKRDAGRAEDVGIFGVKGRCSERSSGKKIEV